jgi:hypothetical protein
VSLVGGGEIETLREASDYIIALPEREHSLPHWQTAMRCVIEGGWRRSSLTHQNFNVEM